MTNLIVMVSLPEMFADSEVKYFQLYAYRDECSFCLRIQSLGMNGNEAVRNFSILHLVKRIFTHSHQFLAQMYS